MIQKELLSIVEKHWTPSVLSYLANSSTSGLTTSIWCIQILCPSKCSAGDCLSKSTHLTFIGKPAKKTSKVTRYPAIFVLKEEVRMSSFSIKNCTLKFLKLPCWCWRIPRQLWQHCDCSSKQSGHPKLAQSTKFWVKKLPRPTAHFTQSRWRSVANCDPGSTCLQQNHMVPSHHGPYWQLMGMRFHLINLLVPAHVSSHQQLNNYVHTCNTCQQYKDTLACKVQSASSIWLAV
jgi:hypothetical protein